MHREKQENDAQSLMIKKKGTLQVADGTPLMNELEKAIAGLKDGTYEFYIFDDKQNRVLPQLKYLNGVVLRTISEQLPTHPPIGALYRYFEKEFAPPHFCNINGSTICYRDLKSEPSTEMSDVIEAIIHHAQVVFGIHVPSLEEMKTAAAKELYADAYADAWKDYFNNNSPNS